MRRFLALISALVLVAALAGSSLAAAPVAKVNHFVGNFDMLAQDGSGRVVGHVVAKFKEPSYSQMVPGTLDVYWAPYDVASPPFPFMTTLLWPPVKESHAQLLESGFDTVYNPAGFHVVNAGTHGYLCDYTAPWNAGCRQFWVIFVQIVEKTGPNVAMWSVDQVNWYFFDVGKGAFDITFAGDTGS
jgi:hypothetical protein